MYSRIREEYERSGNNAQAVGRGLERTRRLIAWEDAGGPKTLSPWPTPVAPEQLDAGQDLGLSHPGPAHPHGGVSDAGPVLAKQRVDYLSG